MPAGAGELGGWRAQKSLENCLRTMPKLEARGREAVSRPAPVWTFIERGFEPMLRHICLPAAIVMMLAGCGDAASTQDEPQGGNPLRSQIVQQCKDWMALQSATSETESPDIFTAKGSGACISGEIDSDLQEKVLAWLREVPSQTKPILVIRSAGGDAFAAIDIAETLQKRDAEVYIYDVCASSCANYIYSGVRQRHSLGSTILVFHGGITKDTAEETGQAFDELLNSEDGKYIENPETERKNWINRAKLYLEKQDKLLVAAGVDPVIIHGFSRMDISDIASEDCDPVREPDLEYALFFSEPMVENLGIAPLSGRLEYRANVINERLNRRTKGNKACAAPEKYFRPAAS